MGGWFRAGLASRRETPATGPVGNDVTGWHWSTSRNCVLAELGQNSSGGGGEIDADDEFVG